MFLSKIMDSTKITEAFKTENHTCWCEVIGALLSVLSQCSNISPVGLCRMTFCYGRCSVRLMCSFCSSCKSWEISSAVSFFCFTISKSVWSALLCWTGGLITENTLFDKTQKHWNKIMPQKLSMDLDLYWSQNISFSLALKHSFQL